MYADDRPDDDLLASEQPPFDEHLDRERGVFIEPDAYEKAGDPEHVTSAPDDFVEDPFADEVGVPGTVDDIPNTFGVENHKAADEHLVVEGATKPAGKERPEESESMGAADENDLWVQQQALIQEDSGTGLRLATFPDEEIPDILEAMGDDAAEALPDFPNGTSATGDWSSPPHGGFPERKE